MLVESLTSSNPRLRPEWKPFFKVGRCINVNAEEE